MRLAPLFLLSGAVVTALSGEDALESPRWDRPTVSHEGNNIGNGDGGGIKIDTEGGDIGDSGVGGCNPAACDKCQKTGDQSGYCDKGSIPNVLGGILGQTPGCCICVPNPPDCDPLPPSCNRQCCASGLTCCNGARTDLQNTASNCGTCGNICPAGTACSSGPCVKSCKGSGSFQPQVTIPVGSTPADVTVGDFNKDDYLDIVAINPGDNTVSVLPGDGLGSFQMQATLAVESGPFDIKVGDFNGNGYLDIVTTASISNTVSILLGTGSGFQPQTTFPVGSQPDGIAVGDFNGDGALDIVAANSISNTEVSCLGFVTVS